MAEYLTTFQLSYHHWKQIEGIDIYLIDVGFAFTLKIISNREKDQDDIALLMKILRIQTRSDAQRIINRYLDEDTQEEQEVQLQLDEIFK